LGLLLLAMASCTKAHRIAQGATGEFFFHGILLNQYNEPIPHAVVTLSASRISAFLGTISSGSSKLRATSNERGEFSFTDVAGYSFKIDSVEKPGCLFMLRPFYYNYSNVGTPLPKDISAPDRPCVIRGWRSAVQEEVAKIDFKNPEPRLECTSAAGISGVLRLRIDVRDDPALDPSKTWSATFVKVPADDATADWDLEIGWDTAMHMPPPTEDLDSLFPPWLPAPTAVRVRARHGGVQQADWRYPYLAPAEGYRDAIALDWSNSEVLQATNRRFAVYYYDARTLRYAYVRLAYHADFIKDLSQPTPPWTEKSVWRPNVMRVFCDHSCGEPAGVINPYGSRVLEYSSTYNAQQIEQRMKPIREKEQADRDARREAKLDWFRKNDPAEAHLIEERMRSQGKVVPPPKN
jgi:hypothetical protein